MTCAIPPERPINQIEERVNLVGYGNPEIALFYRVTQDDRRHLLLTPDAAQFAPSLDVDWRVSTDHHSFEWSALAGPIDAFKRFGLYPTGGMPRDGGGEDHEEIEKEMAKDPRFEL